MHAWKRNKWICIHTADDKIYIWITYVPIYTLYRRKQIDWSHKYILLYEYVIPLLTKKYIKITPNPTQTRKYLHMYFSSPFLQNIYCCTRISRGLSQKMKSFASTALHPTGKYSSVYCPFSRMWFNFSYVRRDKHELWIVLHCCPETFIWLYVLCELSLPCNCRPTKRSLNEASKLTRS